MMLAYACVDVTQKATERCRECKRTYQPGMALQGFCSSECTLRFIARKKGRSNVAK